jgi:hypothetical protein
VNTSSRKDNVLLYGCRRPKAAFDIYARCAISACMVGPGDESTAMDIRDQAHRIWRGVPRPDKVQWDHLFEARHSNVDIFKKGHELLKKQGMLARLKPDYNTTPKVPTIKQPHIAWATPKSTNSIQHATQHTTQHATQYATQHATQHAIQHIPNQIASKSIISSSPYNSCPR